MDNQLPQWKLMLIQNNMIRKSHKEIADMIGIDVNQVAAHISSINPIGAIITRQMKLDITKAARPEREIKIREPRPPRPKKQVPNKVITKILTPTATEHWAQNKRRKEEGRGKFATLVVDYTQCITIRIDSKTTLVVKPGEDPQKKLDHFYKHYKRYFQKQPLIEDYDQATV